VAYGDPMVTLAEQLYLLAEDAATGRPLIDPTYVGRGLGGALLLDLALRRRVALVDSCVVTTSREPTGEPLLDAAHTTIGRQTRTHGPDHWVRHLARGAHAAVQEHLIVIGVLRREDRRILQVIHLHRTRETDGRLHHELLDHLHDAVVLDHTPAPETAALASLALAVRLDRRLFPRSDRSAVRHRMGEVAARCSDGAWVTSAVTAAINAADAASGITPASDAFP
jgi:hypothetical protein